MVTATKTLIAKKLPRKPSGILLAAAEDAGKCMLNPRVMFNMGVYVAGDEGKCEVCMAGAVLLERYPALVKQKLDRTGYVDTDSLGSQADTNKVESVNSFRLWSPGDPLADVFDWYSLRKQLNAKRIMAGLSKIYEESSPNSCSSKRDEVVVLIDYFRKAGEFLAKHGH